MQTNPLAKFKQVTCKRAACGRTVIDDRYFLEPGLIGVGSYSKVRKAQDTSQKREVAVKICAVGYLKKQNEAYRDEDGELRYRSGLDKILSEILILGQLKTHPGCCEIFDVLWDSFEDRLYIIMELGDLGEALRWDHELKVFFVRTNPHPIKPSEAPGSYPKQAIKRVDEEDADEDEVADDHKGNQGVAKLSDLQNRKFLQETTVRWIMKHILQILLDLHGLRIVHRDIKPQNIVMKSEFQTVRLKMVDFGEAVQLPVHSSLLRGSAGTLQFMAPEVGRRVKVEGFDAFKAETWSFGCTLYCFYYLQPPIWADSLVDLFKAIETGAWTFLDHIRPASETLKDVIRKCLIIDADKRPTLEEIGQLEWFQGETKAWDPLEDSD